VPEGRSQRQRVSALERQHRIALPAAQKMLGRTRALIYERGIAAASTRDIARVCGLSGTAPLFYFGTKGRLLIEVLRVDHEQRLAGLCARVEPAGSHGELLDAVAGTLQAFLEERRLRGAHELIAEITRLALEDREVASERAHMRREYRDVFGRLLGDKQREGVVTLSAHATVVAGLLISLAQGLAVEITADPGWRPAETIENAQIMIAALLRAPATDGTKRPARVAGLGDQALPDVRRTVT
jgi:AcrR family transcriptional regulator